MRPLNVRDQVAVIFAFAVGVAIVVLALGAALTEAGVGTGNLSSQSSTLLSTVLGAAVGAIATYLGTRNTEPPPEVFEEEPTAAVWPPREP